MDELVFLGIVALLWLVIVPIIILVKLADLRGKVREQEEYLQWKVAKLEERLNRLESGQVSASAAEAMLDQAVEGTPEPADEGAPLASESMPDGAFMEPVPTAPAFDNALLSAPLPTVAFTPETTQNLEVSAAPEMPQTPPASKAPAGPAAPPFLPPEPPPISDPLADIIKLGQQILRKSNMWVLGGTILLLCALVFLAKLAIDAGWYTPSLRLASGGLLGVALLIFGWRSRENKPQLGQILQGGGVAAFYLVVVAAVKLHDMIPPLVGLPLLLLLVLLASILAVMQNAAWMAHVSMISGFLAPVIMSDGSGNYVALFSVFIALNAGVMLIFHFRNWGHLCLTAFLLTYGIGGIWGLDAYEPQMWMRVEPFLLAFTACYAWIAWRLNGLAAKENSDAAALDNSHGLAATVFSAPRMHLFFILATPATFLLYQLTVVGHLPFAMAFTGLALGFIYLAGARLTWKRHGQGRPYDAQVYFALAVTGLNLALLFAGLDTGADRAVMLFYLGVAWVVEGGLFVYLTRNNPTQTLTKPAFMRFLGGALLLVGSFISCFYALQMVGEDMSVYDGRGAGINIHILAGTILAAVSCLAAAWGCRTTLKPAFEADSRTLSLNTITAYSPVYPVCFILSGLWLLAGLHTAFAEFTYNLTWSNLALTLFVSGAMFIRARLAWADLRCLLLLPLVFALPTLFSAIQTIWIVLEASDFYELTYTALPLGEFAYTAAPLALFFVPLAIDCLLSRQLDSKARDLTMLLVPGIVFAVVMACLPTLVYAALPTTLTSLFSDFWFPLLPLTLALLTLGALIRLAPAYGPAQTALSPKTRLSVWYLAAALPILKTLIWQGNTLFAEAWANPLPYIPLLNPLDLGAAMTSLVLWFWWQRTVAIHRQSLPKPLSAVPGIALISLMAFAAGHGVILRAVAALAYNSIYVLDVFPQQLAQVCITLYWGLCGFTLMFSGSRFKMRRLWVCGSLLLLAAAVKTIFVDTSSAATLARVAVYSGMGVLYICAGYFNPIPGGRNRENAPENENSSPGEK